MSLFYPLGESVSLGKKSIPAEIREHTGLLPHTEVELNSIARSCVLSAPTPEKSAVATPALWPICAAVAMSTDEIIALTRED